jgi:enoyl-CoA hydratase/carnithine racemase
VYRLAERCGPARAKGIVFGAETYDAATFERWNIVNRVVPGEDLREAALAWGQQLAKGPTLAHAVTKRLVRHALDHSSRQADGTSSTSRLPCSKAATCSTRSSG